MVKGIKEAVAALRRDPDQPVTVEIDGLVLELRHKRNPAGIKAEPEKKPRRTADDIFREVGNWEGETATRSSPA